jgi:hypothetical protein
MRSLSGSSAEKELVQLLPALSVQRCSAVSHTTAYSIPKHVSSSTDVRHTKQLLQSRERNLLPNAIDVEKKLPSLLLKVAK